MESLENQWVQGRRIDKEKTRKERQRANIYKIQATRGMKTAHRPTPQPSIANRSKPLMQSFHSSPASSAMPLGHLDAFFLPSLDSLNAPSSAAQTPSMPTLPDNFASKKAAAAEAPAVAPSVTIVAANPDNVASNSALSEINGLDTVWLNFAQQNQGAAAEDHSHKGGMVKDLWKGL
jgi:hypothetical protein